MSEIERYIVVWQKCHENSQMSRQFFVPEYAGFLPFFLSGNDLIALENKESVVLEKTPT